MLFRSGKVTGTMLDPQLKNHLAVIEQHLATQTWFAGDSPSGADILMSFPLQAASARANLSQLPSIQRFVAQMEARPAYQKAVERAGPLTPMR